MPTKTQIEYFVKACGTARFSYNWALGQWKQRYELGEKPKSSTLKKIFNSIRKQEFPWTCDVHRDCTAQPFANLQKAFSSFFKKKTGYPKFHKKGQRDSFYIANDKISFDEKKVRIPVLGWVSMRETLRFAGKVMSATVSRVADRWMLAVQVNVGDYHKDRIGNEKIGVDLGITTLATLSTDEKIEGPKSLGKYLKRLQRLSRRHSRKLKGSSNRKKAADRLARLHCKIKDIRQDSLHKLTTRLCRENQTIIIEDLNVKSMVQNRYLARSLSDAAFGEFRRQTTYKSVIYKTDLQVADRWFPSSKTCSSCGDIKDLQLSDRTFNCKCGLVLDRDHNAALNLKQLPRATREVKPVEKKALVSKDTKLSSLKQEFHSDQSLRK